VGFVHQASKEGSGGMASMVVVWTTHRGTGKPGTPSASLPRGRPTAVTVDEIMLPKGGGANELERAVAPRHFSH
jgi:hypothetical protein